MSRTITVLGLTQLFLVIAGFLALGVVMKFNGYPNDPPVARWNQLALWLREYGLFLLFVPATWTAATAIAENRERFLFPTEEWIGLGILLTIVLFCPFFYACCNPFTRSILWYFGY